ncbi:MAG: methylmalonyl-CoA mutase family protein, partial [Phycisphaeraceae bacterium]|nr:methylmalonyl-CoA mutase family protein [Phycisphaeraceae bacterium]
QLSRLKQVRAERDEPTVQALLARLQAVVEDESQNVMPVTIELVKAGATMGDIVEALREVWGTYRESPVF